MKKILSTLLLLIVHPLIAQTSQECAPTQISEQNPYCIDDFVDNYEDSDVDSAAPEPRVSWPGRIRDPFYRQVVGEHEAQH